MQWRGLELVVSGLLVVVAGQEGGQAGCRARCQQVYSVHTTEFEQIGEALSACQLGCEFFSRIQFRNGAEESLTNLQGCNFSCEERYEGPGRPACQSGCGFHFDGHVTRPTPRTAGPSIRPDFRPEPPRPTFRMPEPSLPSVMVGEPQRLRTEPSGPTMMRSEPPRPLIRSDPQRPSIRIPEVPFMSMSRPNSNPFLNLLNMPRLDMSPGPIMIRRPGPPPQLNIPQLLHGLPQQRMLQHGGPPQHGPPQPQQSGPSPASMGPMVLKQQARGPTVIGFSLPQLLSRVSELMPGLQEQQGHQGHQMDQVVNRVEQLVEESIPRLENRLLEIDLDEPFGESFGDIMEAPRMSEEPSFGGLFGRKDEEPSFGGLFGRKDDDREPFDGLVNGFMDGFMDKLLSSIPSQVSQLKSWGSGLPLGSPHHTGQMTIIKAGPGFHEEKHFEIGPNGEFVEQESPSFTQDGLDHENPMDTHFDFNDVEIFHDNDKDITKLAKLSDVETVEEKEVKENNEKLELEPVMDVRKVEEHDKEPEVGEKVKETEIKEVEENMEQEKKVHDVEADIGVSLPQTQEFPFLSVLRNSVAENERLSQQLLHQFQEYHMNMAREAGWGDDNTCSSRHMKWSDWVACLHQRVGVPRWLTAATISLGIIFSVWLCLVIPSAAPKQKLRALVIKKADKPSLAAAAAKAKEAESASAKAKEVEASLSVSVVTVDMPPTYCPGSPAPSYKSDMAGPPEMPGSPAPSYRSVDIPAEVNKDKVRLEPVEPAVHGENKDERESIA